MTDVIPLGITLSWMLFYSQVEDLIVVFLFCGMTSNNLVIWFALYYNR